MRLFSVSVVSLEYKDTPKFISDAFWARSEKLTGVPGLVYGMKPLDTTISPELHTYVLKYRQ
jgi:hypothetical protein